VALGYSILYYRKLIYIVELLISFEIEDFGGDDYLLYFCTTFPLVHLASWCPYLIGRHFKVKIDHDNMKYSFEKQLSSKE
jgi:hypothetical protein